MRAVHIRTVGSNGGPEALEMLTNLPLPWTELTPTSVLVRVRAAGVNRPDVLQRRGLYPPPPGHSPLPGLEVSGTIVAAGAAVQLSGGGNGGESLDLALGDEVCALTNGGGYAEYCAVDVGACLRLPASSSFCAVEAACVPETFCTVWHNVYRQCNAFSESLLDRPSPSLLVHGGSSGIGTAASAMGSALGNLLLVLVNRTTPANVIAPLIYSQLVVATVLGVLVFKEWPDGTTIVGLLIIAGAGVSSIWFAGRGR